MKTTPKIIKILLAIATAGALITLFVIYNNYKKHMTTERYLKNGGFERKRVAYDLNLVQEFPLLNPNNNIVSLDQGVTVIRNFNANSIVSYDSDNTKKMHALNVAGRDESIFEIKNALQPCTLDIFKNNAKEIVTFDLNGNKIISRYVNDQYFDKGIRLDREKFLLLTDDGKDNTMSFKIVDFGRRKPLTLRQSKFKVKSMAEDGLLLKWNNSFLHLNFYTHDFYVFDSLLNKSYAAHTIDTVSTLPVIESLRNGEMMKFKNQPRPVNQLAVIKGDTLIINSLMKGDREELSLKTTSVFDMYKLSEKGKYIGSFYLDKYKGQRLNDFKIKQNKLAVIYENGLFIYDFSL